MYMYICLGSNPETWTNVKSGDHFITVIAKCPDQKKTIEKKFEFQIL